MVIPKETAAGQRLKSPFHFFVFMSYLVLGLQQSPNMNPHLIRPPPQPPSPQEIQ